MGNDVFANGREVSCKAADGKSICAFPDVCFTPPENPATPPGVPIPYPNTGMAKDMTSGSKKVKVSGKEVVLKNKSYFKKSTGNEAGSAAKKGVVTSTNRGKVYFNSWSMDVKFEGQNVVRHLDLTTHNHASQTGQTPPWPYGDSQAFAEGGACNKPPPKDYANQVKENCSTPHPEDDFSDECCKARRCMMVPFSPNKCCSKDGVQMTPHHPIPYMDHYEAGARKLKVAERNKARSPGAGSYNGEKAPCICLEGKDHGVMEPGDIRHMQHGRCGRAFAYFRDKKLTGKTYKYEETSPKVAQIVEEVSGCDPDCIKAQMDEYHVDRVNATGDLRKSKQIRKGGREYLDETMPTD